MKIKLFKNKRLRLIVSYIAIAIIPLVIINFLTITFFSNIINDIENALLSYSTMHVSENVSNKIANYKDVISQIATNLEIIELFEHFCAAPPQSSEAALVRNQLINKFLFYIQRDSDISGIAFVTDSLDAVVVDRSNYASANLMRKWSNKDFLNNFITRYKASSNTISKIEIISAINFDTVPENVNQYLYFVTAAKEMFNNRDYGILIMEVNNTIFNSVIDMRNSNVISNIYANLLSVISDKNGGIVISPNYNLIGLNISDYLNNIDTKQIIHKSFPVRGTQLILHLILYKNVLTQYRKTFINLTIIISIALTVLLVIITLLMTRRMWHNTRKIVNTIKEFSKNPQDLTIDIDQDDEILYTIASQFNIMSSKITALINELNEKNKYIVNMMDQRRKAEIKALQAQINPHFLYNALDRINWIAIENEQYEISQMLNELANLLRYSISNIDTVVPLHLEIEWLKKYIFIQSKRFEKEINFICSASKEAMNFPIYKMLLQPLVENSITHGFAYSYANNTIKILANILPNNQLKIVLSDNGVGMDEQTLIKIRQTIEQKGNYQVWDKIGINNVITRLRLYYGNQAYVNVESTINKGTTFTIIIPYPNEMQNNGILLPNTN